MRSSRCAIVITRKPQDQFKLGSLLTDEESAIFERAQQDRMLT